MIFKLDHITCHQKIQIILSYELFLNLISNFLQFEQILTKINNVFTYLPKDYKNLNNR